MYGIEKLEASLPTINNQFINGLNFQMDFTRTQSYNKKKFKECYEKIFTNIPAISGCVKLGRLNGMIQNSVYYREMGDTLSYIIKYYSKSESKLTNNIDRYVTILSNLESFLRDNKDSILENLKQIFINCEKTLFKEAWNTQIEEIEIDKLLELFFNKLENSDNLPEEERQDVFKAFFDNLVSNKRNLKAILKSNDIEILNKLNYFYNRSDIKEFNTNGIFKIQMMHNWNSLRMKKGVGIEKKYEVFCKTATIACNDCIHGVINKIINTIKGNKNNNSKELKTTLLEYLEAMKNYAINEIQKCGLFIDKTQSLVPNNFWKQKTINYKLFEKQQNVEPVKQDNMQNNTSKWSCNIV